MSKRWHKMASAVYRELHGDQAWEGLGAAARDRYLEVFTKVGREVFAPKGHRAAIEPLLRLWPVSRNAEYVGNRYAMRLEKFPLEVVQHVVRTLETSWAGLRIPPLAHIRELCAEEVRRRTPAPAVEPVDEERAELCRAILHACSEQIGLGQIYSAAELAELRGRGEAPPLVEPALLEDARRLLGEGDSASTSPEPTPRPIQEESR